MSPKIKQATLENTEDWDIYGELCKRVAKYGEAKSLNAPDDVLNLFLNRVEDSLNELRPRVSC